MQGIFNESNMEAPIKNLIQLVTRILPRSRVKVDAPELPGGNYWVDVSMGKKRHTLEYRPGKGFGLFHQDAGYGEGPSEIYRTPERAAQRLAQLMGTGSSRLGLKDIRELYGQSQVALAKKAGVKQPAISRFEKRGEVKLSTLAATIKALGGKLEVRARFSDADVPISLLASKK
jgi:DNA-binding phage protein